MIQYRLTVPGPKARTAASLLIAAIFALNLFRAATQSITGDEAFAWQRYLNGPPGRLINYYDAAHHVLHTVLCRLFVSLLPLSEFTLRIPSLLGGLLYLVSVRRLASVAFGEGRLFLLADALLTLNPLLLDYMSASRGYGLALGFFFWALLQMSHWFDAPDAAQGTLRKAAVGLALAVSANLAFLIPSAALAAVFLALFLREARSPGAGRFSQAIDCFVVPGIAISFMILVVPLSKAEAKHFYVGSKSLAETLRSLAALSLFHHPTPWATRAGSSLVVASFWLVEKLIVPLCLVAATLALLSMALRRLRQGGYVLALAAGTLLLTLAGHVVLRHSIGLLYPYGRTGLYLIPLFLLSCLGLWKGVAGRRRVRQLAGPPLVILGLACLVAFLAQLQVTHYGEWRYDSSTKKLVDRIRAEHHRAPSTNVRVGVSWMLEPSMAFYRSLHRLDWMQPLDRSGPDGDFDYYVLLPEDKGLIEKRGLAVIWKDDLSTALLAVPGRRGRMPIP